MGKYNFVERFQRMVDHQCRLDRRNAILSKEAAKYHESLNDLKKKIQHNSHQLHEYNLKNQKDSAKCQQLQKNIEIETQKLRDAANEVQNSKELLQDLEHVDEDNSKLVLLLQCLQKSSNIYINMMTLPESIQGFSKCNRGDCSQLVPFQVKPSDLTNQETQDIVWRGLPSESSLDEAWNYLFSENLQVKVNGTSTNDSQTELKTS